MSLSIAGNATSCIKVEDGFAVSDLSLDSSITENEDPSNVESYSNRSETDRSYDGVGISGIIFAIYVYEMKFCCILLTYLLAIISI